MLKRRAKPAPKAQTATVVLEPDNRIADHAKLTPADVALILKLKDAGKTQAEIAQVIGCHQSSVCRCLQEFDDTTVQATHLLKNGAERLVKRILDQADVEQSLEVLDRIDVAPKRRDESASQGVTVVVQQNLQIPGINPVNVIANYQTQSKHVGQQAQALTAAYTTSDEAKG